MKQAVQRKRLGCIHLEATRLVLYILEEGAQDGASPFLPLTPTLFPATLALCVKGGPLEKRCQVLLLQAWICPGCCWQSEHP